MDKLIISGPNTLKGKVTISSSKNATLPIMAATLLVEGKVPFVDLPMLSDVHFFKKILESLGAKISTEENITLIDNSNISHTTADYELVRKMRASILVLGPLLARFHHAKVSLPGGCAIGTRPVDIHLSGLEKMGAQIEIEGGYVNAHAPGGLKGAVIDLKFPSVGATENLLMAAALAEGETVINNAACEPEIEDLIRFLSLMGVEISGVGSRHLFIRGKKDSLHYPPSQESYRVIGDRIEAATFLIAGLMCPSSDVLVLGIEPKHLTSVITILRAMGANLEVGDDYIRAIYSGRLKSTVVETEPYPGFPTDVQAQLMSLMGICEGKSVISEHIFENRFMHIPELVRMGMKISTEGHVAKIEGVNKVSSAPVMCTDLRASAALVLAGLVANGETQVHRIYHLDRGYAYLAEKLQGLGAKILRVPSS